MLRFLSRTRYLILIPIIGLAIAAAIFFIFGGFGLIKLLIQTVGEIISGQINSTTGGAEVIVFEVIEYVHTLLVGTVLYITAVGLYQLFIKEVKFVGWLKVDSTEELETNLIGVTVVVLAVNFMGTAFGGNVAELQQYGVGIALPIAALGLFIGLRTWSAKYKSEKNERNKEKITIIEKEEEN